MPERENGKNHEIFKNVAEHVKRSTVTFWIGGVRAGTGVLLNYGGRFLVGTAAHTIAYMKKGDTVHIAGHESPASSPMSIKRIFGSRDPALPEKDVSTDVYDLGVIEFGAEEAEKLAGAMWLTENNLSSRNMLPGIGAVVIGSPGQYDESYGSNPTMNETNLVGFGTFFVTTPYEELLKGEKLRLSQVRDIALNFEPEKCLDLMTSKTSQGFNPCGMSGCGIFSANYFGNDWTPEQATLAGIQSLWSEDEHILIGRRVELLTDMIDKQYAERLPAGESC